jgi:hypothetical protein
LGLEVSYITSNSTFFKEFGQGSAMRRAGATISGSIANGQSSIANHLGHTTSNRSILNSNTNPGTFKAALEQIEDEILLLA